MNNIHSSISSLDLPARMLISVKAKAKVVSSSFTSNSSTTMQAIQNVGKNHEASLHPVVVSDPHEPPNPLQKHESPYLLTSQADQGKEITHNYEYKGTVYGKEKVERREAVADLKVSLTKQITILEEALDQKKQEQTRDPQSYTLHKQIHFLEAEIQLCKKSLENTQNIGDDFIKSSFYRSEVQKVIDSGQNYEEGIDKICLGGAVNFRYQGCETAQREVGFFRLGVITDPKNGFTNLQELRQLAADPAKLQAKIDVLTKEYDELKKELRKSENGLKKNQGKLAAYHYALKQLSLGRIDATIQEREHILNNQMLQLVQGQVEKNLASLIDDPSKKTLNITHLALLNRKTNSQDPTGWVHDEANEILDMNEVFKDFAGKTLVFDGKGPCMDADGKLHMAQSLEDETGMPREVKLETNFVNITVQGHTKNDGIQEQINTTAVAEIIKKAKQKAAEDPANSDYQDALKLLTKLQKELNNGKSSYRMAEDFSVALIKLDMPLSMGCLSAKDRTGLVAARAILRIVMEDMAKHPAFKNLSKLFEHICHKFERSILDKDACAALVVKDNTNETTLKCSALHFPGYSEGLSGKYRRMRYLGEQVAMTPAATKLRDRLAGETS